MSKGNRSIPVITALLCAVAGLALQFLIVNIRYGGDWTALFCTGSYHPVPAELGGEKVYVFQGSTGYDGQTYHYVAHDPLLRTGIWRHLDVARLRYRRILLPAAAFLLAAGRQGSIDTAYIAANLLFLFAGAWWLSRYLDSMGVDARLGALLVLTPAALISLDRLTVDLAFTALCIGFALYARLGQDAKAYTMVTLACLTRETGLVLAAAACLALVWERRFAKAAVFATAVLPAGAWYLYVNSKTPSFYLPDFSQPIPLRGIVETMLRPWTYPFSGVMNASLQWLDRLELAGILVAMAMSVWLWRRSRWGPVTAATVLWSGMAMLMPQSFWLDCFSGGRVFTPLLIYVVLRGWRVARWRAVLPLLMATPRILLQVAGPLVRW